jgi:hypothetical protein
MRRMQISRTRILLVAISCAFLGAGCSGGGESKPRHKVKREPQTMQLMQTIQLPNDQGTIHLIKVPGGSFESSRCVLHVGQAGTGSFVCPAGTSYDFDEPAAADR